MSHEEEEDADASRPPAAEVDPHEPTAVAHLPALAPVHARTALALVAGCPSCGAAPVALLPRACANRAASSCLRRSPATHAGRARTNRGAEDGAEEFGKSADKERERREVWVDGRE